MKLLQISLAHARMRGFYITPTGTTIRVAPGILGYIYFENITQQWRHTHLTKSPLIKLAKELNEIVYKLKKQNE